MRKPLLNLRLIKLSDRNNIKSRINLSRTFKILISTTSSTSAYASIHHLQTLVMTLIKILGLALLMMKVFIVKISMNFMKSLNNVFNKLRSLHKGVSLMT